MSKHYVATAGLFNVLPQCCEAFADIRLAAAYLAEIHDLSDEDTIKLEATGYIELDLNRYGNDYCRITICTCQDPISHCNSGVYESLETITAEQHKAVIHRCELCQGISTRILNGHHLCSACYFSIQREKLLREQDVEIADQQEEERRR
jgi:hypothetical protein